MTHPAETYVTDCLRTESKVGMAVLSNQETRLLHSILGLCDEVGELAKALKAFLFYGKELDYVNLKEEFGDVLWYTALGVDSIQSTLDSVMKTNIEKLRVRYPEKFTKEDALNRNMGEERKELEK